MSRMSLWMEAARPRTLPASVAPVLVGTAASARGVGYQEVIGGDVVIVHWLTVLWGRFALALLVALALQVAVNFANDYFDGVRGVDTPQRAGPRRAVAAGLITAAAMRRAMLLALGVAGLAGLALAALAGWELLIVGALALLAAVGYSGGPRPYASAGLGEVFVFVFFGVVATVGSAYVQDERLTLLAVVASLPMGLLATALLVVNNLRDIPTDEGVGKVTLAVRLGEVRTRRLYALLVVAALVVAIVMAGFTPYLLITVLAWPLALGPLRLVRSAPLGPALVPGLLMTARLQLVLAALLTAGLLWRTPDAILVLSG